ncbi:DUF3164 family protein [Thermophagus sp. OGC60D27]|uniref:DUF3164 family protein n=1 Tax=Thermophagus sp. OGC60D27 TaxID=3458415 RepID=UPI0040383C69
METMNLDLSKMTPEQRAALKQQLIAEEEAEKEKKRKERENYRDNVNKVVGNTIKDLQVLSSFLSQKKAEIFNLFNSLLKQKKELYGYRNGQQSHTFTDNKGNSIVIGFRIIDSWDDTVEAGIAKVNDYIDSLSTNEETAKLVRIIQGFLKKDQKGNLKPSRVLELQKLAKDINDPGLTEAVDIIKDAYKPNRSAYFIEASYKDPVTGKAVNIPLSITSVDFPDGAGVNTDEL